MNTPRAQLFIQRVENVIYNFQQGVDAQRAMDAVVRAYEESYGDSVPVAGTRKNE